MSRLEYLKSIVARMRRYAPYWAYPDRHVRELGVVYKFLEARRYQGMTVYHSPESSPVDPPDCTVRAADGSLVAVEVTELVCSEAARRNQKDIAVYRDWRPDEVVAEIQVRLRDKDLRSSHGGPYAARWLIIYTGEPLITFDTYAAILGAHVFERVKNIDVAYFLFSFEPQVGYCPYVRLGLSMNTDESQGS